MSSRRSHKNSHHGCKQCKQSKVKCDEERPACLRCHRRKLACSFLVADEGSQLRAPSFIHYLRPDAPIVIKPSDDTGQRHYQIIPDSNLDTFSPAHPSSSLSFAIQPEDLELLHQYSTRTYLTLALRPEAQLVWRDKVFVHSLQYQFLLRGMLAVSAMHKAKDTLVHRDLRAHYLTMSNKHQDAALRGFILELNNPTASNCAALYCFSMILTVLSLAAAALPLDEATALASGSKEKEDQVLSKFLEVMKLLQGIHVVIQQTWNWLMESDISTLAKRGVLSESSITAEGLPTEAELSFRILEAKNNSTSKIEQEMCTKAQDQDLGQEPSSANSATEVYSTELQVLRKLLSQTLQSPGYQAETALAWATVAPNTFITLLKQEQPMALAILAHSAACLQTLDRLWWIAGWPKKLVADISMKLDISWHEALKWPRRTVGLS